MRKNKIPTYLDGFIEIYRPLEVKNTFGAKENIRSLSSMSFLYKLAYTQTYKRAQDMDFVESIGRDLTLKVKVRMVSGIKNSDKVLLNDVLYDIVYVDEDRINKELYLYLEEMYELE